MRYSLTLNFYMKRASRRPHHHLHLSKTQKEKGVITTMKAPLLVLAFSEQLAYTLDSTQKICLTLLAVFQIAELIRRQR